MYDILIWVGFAAAFAYVARERRSHGAAWVSLARRLGLAYHGGGSHGVSGTISGTSVSIRATARGSGKGLADLTRFEVSDARAAKGLRITGERAFAGLQRALGPQTVRLGDPDFDRLVHVQGRETTVVAAMDAELRNALGRLVKVAPGAQVTSAGTVEYERAGAEIDPEKDEGLVRRMVEVELALRTRRHDLAAQLAANAIKDPVTGIRRRNLELLVRDFPWSAETRRAGEARLADSSAAVRVMAARALGGESGFAVLQGIADDARGAPEDRLAALEALLSLWPYAQVAPVLGKVLRTGRPEHRLLAVRAIGRARDAMQLGALLAMPTQDATGLAEVVAEVLGQIGDARAETALLESLRNEDAAVRVAAARSLGAVGTVNAVEPLLAHTTGLTLPGAVKEAARDAVRRIQERLGDAESGRLSVIADEQAGALSLASDGGELAIAEEPGRAGRKREPS